MPRTLGGDHVIVAIDDAAYDEAVDRLGRVLSEAGDSGVEFVRASELADPSTEADFWFGRYTPTAPGRELLWVTENFERYEQDERGLVYTNGLLAWPQPPVSYGDPRTREERKLHVFHGCALVFSTPDARGSRVRIRTMGRLIQLAREPRTVEGWAPPDWLIKAYAAMSPFGPDLAATPQAPRRGSHAPNALDADRPRTPTRNVMSRQA